MAHDKKWTPLIGQRGSVLKVESDIIIMLPVRAEKHPRAGKGTQAQGEGAGRGGRLAGSAKKKPGPSGGKARATDRARGPSDGD